MKWDVIRGGLHVLEVDGQMVATVTLGEDRKWYWTTWPHDEETCGRRDTLEDAQADAESSLANP
jgi:hypothetical protein